MLFEFVQVLETKEITFSNKNMSIYPSILPHKVKCFHCWSLALYERMTFLAAYYSFFKLHIWV